MIIFKDILAIFKAKTCQFILFFKIEYLNIFLDVYLCVIIRSIKNVDLKGDKKNLLNRCFTFFYLLVF